MKTIKGILSTVMICCTFLVSQAQTPSGNTTGDKKPIATKPVKIDKQTAAKTNANPRPTKLKLKKYKKVQAKMKENVNQK